MIFDRVDYLENLGNEYALTTLRGTSFDGIRESVEGVPCLALRHSGGTGRPILVELGFLRLIKARGLVLSFDTFDKFPKIISEFQTFVAVLKRCHQALSDVDNCSAHEKLRFGPRLVYT